MHSAAVQEREGGRALLSQIHFPASRLEVIWADTGYEGLPFYEWVRWRFPGCRVESSPRRRHRWSLAPEATAKAAASSVANPTPKGFALHKRRWVVERTFAWLGRWRRLSKDYEQNVRSAQAWIYLAGAMICLRQLSR